MSSQQQRPFAPGISFSEFVGEENARAFAELFGKATGHEQLETYRRVDDAAEPQAAPPPRQDAPSLPTTPPPPPREPYRRFQPPPPPPPTAASQPEPPITSAPPVPRPRENEIPETPRTPVGAGEEDVVMYAPPTPFNPLDEDERPVTPTFPPATPPVPEVIEPATPPAATAQLPIDVPAEREASPVPQPEEPAPREALPIPPPPASPVPPEMPAPPREASPESSPAAPASPGWSPAAPSPIGEPPASPPPRQNVVVDDASAPPLQDLFNVNAGVQAAPRGYVLSVWPLGGLASDQFMVLHVGDPLKAGRRTLAAGQEPFVPNGWREMIVLLDLRTRPIRVERYNYVDRRVQPRWVDGSGHWLSRRTLVVPPDERTRRTQGARRVGNSEQAKPEVPDFVHYVDWHASLTDLLEGRQAALSLLFPSQTTGDFPEHMAMVGNAGADRRVVAIGTTLQITPDSRVYEYKVSDDTQVPAFTAVGDPLGAAEPVATRAAERLYVAGIVNGADDKQVVVWNGNAFTFENGAWDVTGLFALSDGLGSNVTTFSGVRLGADRFYYVSNEQLWLQRRLEDDPERIVLSDAVDVVSVARGPGNTLLVSGKPYGADRVATVVAVAPQVREWGIDRAQLGLDPDVTVKAIRWQPTLQRFVVVAGPRVFTASLRAVNLQSDLL